MEPFKKFSLMDESKVITSYNTILNLSPMELTELEKKFFKLETDLDYDPNMADHFEMEISEAKGCAQLCQSEIDSECLKKNEEIERLMNKLIEWQHIASDMQKSSRELESKLQASEERVKELEKELFNIRSNYTLRSRNSEQ